MTLTDVWNPQRPSGMPYHRYRPHHERVRVPVDPRLGRMLIEADRRGCLTEVLVVVSALSIQDPRERPLERQAQADQQHARFRHETSDFATWW